MRAITQNLIVPIVTIGFLTLTVSSFPTGPAAARPIVIHCENDKDCPKSESCKIKTGHKTGICTSLKKKHHHS
jgi:hypothetical protein